MRLRFLGLCLVVLFLISGARCSRPGLDVKSFDILFIVQRDREADQILLDLTLDFSRLFKLRPNNINDLRVAVCTWDDYLEKKKIMFQKPDDEFKDKFKNMYKVQDEEPTVDMMRFCVQQVSVMREDLNPDFVVRPNSIKIAIALIKHIFGVHDIRKNLYKRDTEVLIRILGYHRFAFVNVFYNYDHYGIIYDRFLSRFLRPYDNFGLLNSTFSPALKNVTQPDRIGVLVNLIDYLTSMSDERIEYSSNLVDKNFNPNILIGHVKKGILPTAHHDLNSTMKSWFINENEETPFIRTSAPNIFTFGDYDVVSTLYKNKLTKTDTELRSHLYETKDAHNMLRKKIEHTNYLVVGATSMIQCLGLVYANKLLSHAYSVINAYVDENYETVPLFRTNRDLYLEPVFIFSAAQAAYCNIVADPQNILKTHYASETSAKCPYVFMVMKGVADGYDYDLGRPIYSVKIDIVENACARTETVAWLPWGSCMEPDAYQLPFGIRSSLNNMRVLSIIDLVKSEDNMRNIDYSLQVREYTTKVDELYLYDCHASKCFDYFLTRAEGRIWNKNKYVNLRCPLENVVVPESYAEFNVKPFVAATNNQIVNMLEYDYDHIFSTTPYMLNQHSESMPIDLNVNRHQGLLGLSDKLAPYNLEGCYTRAWALNYTLNGSAAWEKNELPQNDDIYTYANMSDPNGYPFNTYSYSMFYPEVL